MDTSTFLAVLRGRGVKLVVNGDRLRWNPRDALTSDEVEQLRQNKSAMIRLLSESTGISSGGISEHRNHSAPISSKPSKGSAYPSEPDRLKIYSTGATPLPSLPSCGAHLDPSLWQRKPVAARPGWEESTCKYCGKFIGYSLISKAQSKFTD